MNSADVVVVGAGVFGSWIAYLLRKTGRSVILLESQSPGHARASSGGETRIIRMSYGPHELYTRFAIRSMQLWQDLDQQASEKLFYRTGVLLLARNDVPYAPATAATLKQLNVHCEQLSRSDLEYRYPQFEFGPINWGLLEPDSGVIAARRAVKATFELALKAGVTAYRGVATPASSAGLPNGLTTTDNETIQAGTYVFACGPWLPTLFPEILSKCLYPTRQEVFFFGAPPGDNRFAPPNLPTNIKFGGEAYCVPDLDGRGVKIGMDHHGQRIDPDNDDRIPSTEKLHRAQLILGSRFPALRGAPLVESRVCQYTNTSSGDFLVDRHPKHSNIWLVGGGSGHGFKHGPAVADYFISQLDGRVPAEPQLTLATKNTVLQRTVY